jgi:hypothetical protein
MKPGPLPFFIEDSGKDFEIGPFLPTQGFPKDHASGVVWKNEEMAFGNTGLVQGLQSAFHQPSPHSPAPIIPMNRYMINITTAAVMTGQDRPDNPSVEAGHETRSGVLQEKTIERFFRIGLAQTQAFALAPQGKDFLIILDGEWQNGQGHGCLPTKDFC